MRNYALRLGLLTYKFSSPGHKGVPDRMFINSNGVAAFLELKAPGRRPTRLQMREINRLKVRGVLVGWSDNIDFCKEFLDNLASL